MVSCSFCGYDIEKGCGKEVILRDGKKLRFCSSKCEKNMLKLKRKAKNLKWTKFYVKK